MQALWSGFFAAAARVRRERAPERTARARKGSHEGKEDRPRTLAAVGAQGGWSEGLRSRGLLVRCS